MIARFTPKYSVPVFGKEEDILLQDMYKSSIILSANLYNILVLRYIVNIIQSKVGARMIDAEFALSPYAYNMKIGIAYGRVSPS